MNTLELKQLTTDLSTLGVSIPQISIFHGESPGGSIIAQAANSYIQNALLNANSVMSLTGLFNAIIEIAPLAFLFEGWSRVAQAQQEQSFADRQFERYLSDRAAARKTIDAYIEGVGILKKLKNEILATHQVFWDLQTTISIPHTYGSKPTRTFTYASHLQKDFPYTYPVTIWVHHVPTHKTASVMGIHVHVVDEYTIPANTTGLSAEDYKSVTDWLKYYLIDEVKNPDIAQSWRYASSQFWSQLSNQSHNMLGKMFETVNASYASLNHFNQIISLLALRVAQAKEAERVQAAIGRAQVFKKQAQQRPLDLLTYRLLGLKL